MRKLIWLSPLIFGYYLALVYATQFTAWTEMLTYPFILNHGFVMYRDIILPYTPLALWGLQLIDHLSSLTPQSIQLLTLILALLNTAAVGWSVQKLFKNQLAVILAVLFYSLWFFYFEGNGLWFELIQTTPIIIGMTWAYQWQWLQPKQTNFYRAVIWLTLSFLIKQSAIWYLAILALWNFKPNLWWRSGLIFLAMIAGSFVITAILADPLAYGQWAYLFSFVQFPFSPGHSQYPTAGQLLKLLVPLTVLLPLVWQRDKKSSWILTMLAASFLAAFPRWGLFHLQPFLALLAIFSVESWVSLLNKFKVWQIVGGILVVVWIIVIVRQLDRFWNQPIRFFEPPIYSLANQLANYPDTYIFNGPDQLYVLNHRPPIVKPYVQNFAWYLEGTDLQSRLVQGLAQSQPKYILYQPIQQPYSNQVGFYRPQLVMDYIEQHYQFFRQLDQSDQLLIRR